MKIPAVPVAHRPPVMLLRWGMLTHVAIHTSTSNQARLLTEKPRGKSSCLSSWCATSRRLRALCFSSGGWKPHRRAAYRLPVRAHFPAARWVQTRLLQYGELHVGLSFSLLITVEVVITLAVKKKQYLKGILVSIATLIYGFYYVTN